VVVGAVRIALGAALLVAAQSVLRAASHTDSARWRAGPQLVGAIGVAGYALAFFGPVKSTGVAVVGAVAVAIAVNPLRVALERALLHAPRLLLLDEPFTGLDQASNRSLGDRLRECQKSGGIVVLATHDLDIVDGVLSRSVFLHNGRQVGEPGPGTGLRERYQQAMSA